MSTFSKILRFYDPSSITSLTVIQALGIMLMLILILMVFIYYYFYSMASSSNSSKQKIMVSTPTSSIQKRFKYDVFLSFRGEDTRKNFVGHLYEALNAKGIYTYKDDVRIHQGKTISDELIKAIEDSRFYIIVFSKNYASSSWCLDDVEPTQVRNQIGAVKNAFSNNKKKEAAQKWRDAMKEATNLAGWELKNTNDGDEAKFIKTIVQEILLELRPINSGFDKMLVGMETRVKDVVSSLKVGIDDVRMIGIKGMGGAGKTTTARAVFDHLSADFEAKSFVENVREVSTNLGLNKLQGQILSDVLNEHVTVNAVTDGKIMMKNRMCRIKVLLVLDDVNHVDQLEALAGGPNWFKPGSRIIVTTRDEQVLVAHRVKLIPDIDLLSDKEAICRRDEQVLEAQRVNVIRDIDLLSDKEAICLLSRYAFGREIPSQGYEELSGKVVRYAAGLPLTVKVLGSFLCGKDEHEWKDAIERLKEIPLQETQEKLELSYTSLEKDCKEIFLDIACIFKGKRKQKAIRILECCGFRAINGLKVLEQRSLITISEDGDLGMHDHIEEMGKNIVRREHPNEPNKHSRLWIKEEIEDILADDKGTEATLCIRPLELNINAGTAMKGLGKMKQLRYLQVFFRYQDYCKRDAEDLDNTAQYFPNSLKYLKCCNYPFLYLPKTFQANNLVCLEIKRCRRMEQLWAEGEKKVLKKLKFLSLSRSALTTFDFSMTPNLETLNLSSDKLVKLCMPVSCQELKHLNISDSKLRTFDLGLTPNLEKLSLDHCAEFEELHVSSACLNLKFLELYKSRLRSLDLELFPNIERLDLKGCELVELHVSSACPNLKFLELHKSRLRSLDLELFPNVKELSLNDCADFEELHVSSSCPNLKFLELRKSRLRSVDLELFPNLEKLSLNDCADFEELHVSGACPNLKFLLLHKSRLRSLDLELFPRLQKLSLNDCADFEGLHVSSACPYLQILELHKSRLRSLDLELFPRLKQLFLDDCADFEGLHVSSACPYLQIFELHKSRLRSLDLELFPRLKKLSLNDCADFEGLHVSSACRNLQILELHKSRLIRSFDFELFPRLQKLSLNDCADFEGLHLSSASRYLIFLELHKSRLRILDLELSPNLVKLSLNDCADFNELHVSSACPKLKSLELRKSRLRSLDLELFPNLERLDLKGCDELVEINAPVECLKKVGYLNLNGCLRFSNFVVPVGESEPKDSRSSASLRLVGESLDLCRLHPNSNLPKFQFDCNYEENLPSSVGNIEKLISFGLCACTDFKKFSHMICSLRCLRKLELECDIPEFPKDLGKLECLEELCLSSTKIKHLPDSICMLKCLICLKVDNGDLLEKLPENLGQLECLERLHVRSKKIESLPDSICMLKRLKSLNVRDCSCLGKLLENISQLESLESLDLSATKIKHLPDSICKLKHLNYLNLDDCALLEKLPEDLGRLECFKDLYIAASPKLLLRLYSSEIKNTTCHRRWHSGINSGSSSGGSRQGVSDPCVVEYRPKRARLVY